MFELALSAPAIAASIACAVAYSASDSFRKAVPIEAGALLALFYAFLLEAPILGLWLVLGGDYRLSPGYVLPGAAAAVVGLGANILFMVALRRSPLSLMVPMLALVPVITAVFSGLLLGEWPSWSQSAGIVFVAAGLFALYLPSGAGFSLAAVARAFAREPGTKPMLGVVLLWSINPPVDKLSLAHASVGMHGFVQLIVLAAALGLWLGLRGGVSALRLPAGAMRPLAGVAVTAGIGYGLQLAAYQMTLVAVVELIKRVIGLVGALFLGRAYFQEAITTPKAVGIAIMALGVPLVLLG
jgi:drug/metabolite transporter (DMT)-like permease